VVAQERCLKFKDLRGEILMQKKLLAVAVAGALVAPVAAIAQTSVTVYGTISMSLETRSATGGDGTTAAAAGANYSSLRTASLSAVGGAAVPNVAGTALVTGAGFSATPGVVAGGYVLGTPGSPGVADLASRSTTQGAGSNFGIRVREDLGAGMYAWAQAELSIQAEGVTPVSSGSGGTGPTYRNTGLALGSKAWGDIVFGMWDTPFNVNMSPAPQHAPYGNASTSFSAHGFGGLPWGPATNSGQTLAAMCNGTGTFATTAGGCFAHATAFHRRQSNSLQYWSPNWGGFQLKAVYGAEDLKQANNLVNGATTLKPQMWGGSLSYGAGPLYVGLGYERHNDFTAFAARTGFGAPAALLGATSTGGLYLGGTGTSLAWIPGTVGAAATSSGISGSKDTAWNFNARYTFGAFTIGGYYENLKYTMNYDGTLSGGEVTELRKRAYGLEGAFVTGPHTLGIRYVKARNVEGSTAAVGGVGGSFNGDGSGMNAWIFGYAYSLSKRTSVFGYHTRVTNDTNARYAGIVFNGLSPAAGGDPKYTGIGLRHTF
jgi:predicted porin